MKILICVGTRPNFIKITQFKKVAARMPGMEILILHTGQHYDHNMSSVFFEELELDKPDIYLNATPGGQIELLADIMVKFEKELEQIKPDVVLVPGDVNSSLACALVASRKGYRVGHIESGLRSFDRWMPEEVNRILIDNLSDYFFVTEQSGIDNLIHEGKSEEQIHFVGNTMIDSLVSFTPHIDRSDVISRLALKDDFALTTFHRPSNVDAIETLSEVVSTIEHTSQSLQVVFPVHPRTRNSLQKNNLWEKLNSLKNVVLTDSLGYLDFIKLIKSARLVITDSGGIQEETTFLQVPCLTVRENTERPITITMGTNQLIELKASVIVEQVRQLLSEPQDTQVPPLWDGKSTERILKVLQ